MDYWVLVLAIMLILSGILISVFLVYKKYCGKNWMEYLKNTWYQNGEKKSRVKLNEKTVQFIPGTKTQDGLNVQSRQVYDLIVGNTQWSSYSGDTANRIHEVLKKTLLGSRVQQLEQGKVLNEEDKGKTTYIYGPNRKIVPCDVSEIKKLLTQYKGV